MEGEAYVGTSRDRLQPAWYEHGKVGKEWYDAWLRE